MVLSAGAPGGSPAGELAARPDVPAAVEPAAARSAAARSTGASDRPSVDADAVRPRLSRPPGGVSPPVPEDWGGRVIDRFSSNEGSEGRFGGPLQVPRVGRTDRRRNGDAPTPGPLPGPLLAPLARPVPNRPASARSLDIRGRGLYLLPSREGTGDDPPGAASG